MRGRGHSSHVGVSGLLGKHYANMLALNLRTAASRADEFEVEMSGVADIRGLLSAVPSETARAELSEVLRVIRWALS